MKITYDKEADALYIILRNVPGEDSLDVEDGVTMDLDGEGHTCSEAHELSASNKFL